MVMGIETSFRELKYAIGVTNFHARKGQFVLQEQVMSLLFLYLYIGITVLNLTDVLAKKRPQREIYLKEVLT